MKFEGLSTQGDVKVKAVATTAENLPKDIVSSKNERAGLNGGVLSAPLTAYCAALVGVPKAADLTEYKNSLYTLRKSIVDTPKYLVYMQNHISAPTLDEINFFGGMPRDNSQRMLEGFTRLLSVNGDPMRTEEAKKAFREISAPYMQKTPGEFFTFGSRLITWMRRCVSDRSYPSSCEKDIPIIFYYGDIGKYELYFLHFMSRIGFDVLCVSTDRSSLANYTNVNPDGRMQVFELPESAPVFDFPDKLVRTKMATVAYNAERELDHMMYDGNTLFRDFQFSQMQVVTLKTTYEEIEILWHQPARFRSGFDVADGKIAIVPNLFVKISGVRDNDLNRYWTEIRGRLSPNSFVIEKTADTPEYTREQTAPFLQFVNNRRIDIKRIMESPFNHYSYLTDPLQELIFTKIQEVVDSGLVKLDEKELMPLALSVGLNLPTEIVRVLQKYDFTKDIPKLIIIDAVEQTFGKVECVQLVLYNLLGFDIAVYTPTGYRNIETFVSENAFETYTMNEFVYTVSVPKFKIPSSVPEPKKKSGFFNKLFRKG